jgi:hypothetical protein
MTKEHPRSKPSSVAQLILIAAPPHPEIRCLLPGVLPVNGRALAGKDRVCVLSSNALCKPALITLRACTDVQAIDAAPTRLRSLRPRSATGTASPELLGGHHRSSRCGCTARNRVRPNRLPSQPSVTTERVLPLGLVLSGAAEACELAAAVCWIELVPGRRSRYRPRGVGAAMARHRW